MLPKGILKEYSRAISLLIRGLDMLTVLFSGWLCYLIKFDSLYPPQNYLLALLTAFLLTPIVFFFFNIYASLRAERFFTHSMKLIQAVTVLGLLLGGFSFFTKFGETYSRTWFGMWMVTALLLLLLCRLSILMLLRFMRSRGLNERKVIIFGTGELGLKFARTVQQALWTGFRIHAFMNDDESSASLDLSLEENLTPKPQSIMNIPLIKTPSSLSEYLIANQIDEIWLALPLKSEQKVKAILHELRHSTITTRLVLDIFGLDLLNHSVTEIAGFPVVNIRSTPMVGVNRLVKAIEDRIFASIILITISPLFLFIALLVKCTSQGPVIFKQKRLGWDGKIIKVYKFRTMIEHDEKEDKITQATENDARVTPIGRILRKTSLDELPQFINVLQGRMSIVGPRPHALAHNEMYKDLVPVYMQRHRVKPGITGWAQVNGWRGETNTLNKMQKRVEYDLYYINNWSLGFDLKIIFFTMLHGFIHKNAY